MKAVIRKEEQPAADKGTTFAQLQEIVSTLRGEHGCPWDIKQTPETLTKYIYEECQELIDAIDQKDSDSVCEEIGDVLFLLAFLIAIHEERSQFTRESVLCGIISKMIRRHPHVFAGQKITDEQSLRDQWNRIKSEEKGMPGTRD